MLLLLNNDYSNIIGTMDIVSLEVLDLIVRGEQFTVGVTLRQTGEEVVSFSLITKPAIPTNRKV